MTEPVPVDFYLGLGSRYSYLAASQIERIEARHDCRFVWKPIASGMLMDRAGSNPFRARASGQYDWAYREHDARSWAAHYGIPFREPAEFKVDPAAPALACLAADAQGALVACCRELFNMIFVDGLAIDAAALAALPGRLGLQAERFHQDFTAPGTLLRHEKLLDEAQKRGVFGVPTFFLGERMFWGNDRLVLLEAALTGAGMEPPQRFPH